MIKTVALNDNIFYFYMKKRYYNVVMECFEY